jgi:hypothetical protein
MTSFTSKKLNHLNINDKLIKLLIKKGNDKGDEYDYDSTLSELIHDNNDLCYEIEELKTKLNESTLLNAQYETSMKDVISKLKKIEKQTRNDPGVKYDKIINLIKNTKKRTILYDEINKIINGARGS